MANTYHCAYHNVLAMLQRGNHDDIYAAAKALQDHPMAKYLKVPGLFSMYYYCYRDKLNVPTAAREATRRVELMLHSMQLTDQIEL